MQQIITASNRQQSNSNGINSASTFAEDEAPTPLVSLEEHRLDPGQGFDFSDDKEAEIIYYVIDGELSHERKAIESSTTSAGEVQVTSTGTGLSHRVFNDSDNTVHYLKAVIAPYFDKYTPSANQKSFTADDLKNTGGEDPQFGAGKPFGVVTSTYAEYSSLIARQRGRSFMSYLDAGETTEFEPNYGCQYWLHVVSGEIAANGEVLSSGDGVGFAHGDKAAIEAKGAAQLLLIEVPVGE